MIKTKPDVLQGGLKENIYVSCMLLNIIFNFLLDANCQRNLCHINGKLLFVVIQVFAPKWKIKRNEWKLPQ